MSFYIFLTMNLKDGLLEVDREFCARYIPFGEVDSSPTKSLLMENKNKIGFKRFYDLAFAKRPAEELYDITKDQGKL